MKPFDLEDALAGAPVVLRNGVKAIVIKRLANPLYSYGALIGYQLISDNEYEDPLMWAETGAHYDNCEDYLDIVGMWEEPPKTIKIGDMNVPEPEREPLEKGGTYYVPELSFSTLVSSDTWDGVEFDLCRLERGLVHKTREAATLHAKALLALTERKEDKND